MNSEVIQYADDETTPCPETPPGEDNASLLETWESATPVDRSVFVLAAFGLEKSTIAATCNIDRNKVYRILQRFMPSGDWQKAREAFLSLRLAQWESVATRALLHIDDSKLSQASPKELAVVAGVAEDKIMKLREKMPVGGSGEFGPQDPLEQMDALIAEEAKNRPPGTPGSGS